MRPGWLRKLLGPLACSCPRWYLNPNSMQIVVLPTVEIYVERDGMRAALFERAAGVLVPGLPHYLTKPHANLTDACPLTFVGQA